MSTVVTCPDLHKCRNGAQCKEDSVKEGSYFCDCSNIVSSTNVYAGLSCEHEATVYCNPTNDINHVSYCVNGGTCVRNSDSNNGGAVHYGCDCGSQYTGEYCEFVADQTVPNDWGQITTADNNPAYSKSGGGGGSNANVGAVVGGVIAAAMVLVLFLVGAIWYRKLRFSEPHIVESKSTHDLQLEPDGSTMRDSDDDNTRRTPSPKMQDDNSPQNNYEEDQSVEAVDVI